MEFRILGPLEVWDRGAMLPVRGARQRALLALLVLHGNEVVASDRLIDELWGDKPPPSARTALRVRVSQLRRALASSGPTPLLTRAPGYVLTIEPDRLDAERFERLLTEGRQQLRDGFATEAASTLGDALGLWRGQPLADFTYEPFAQADIARLDELRLIALEERIEADLTLGRHAAVVAELEALIARQRLRERLRGQLMLALYRSGRQAEALEAYGEARRVLVDELGIEPSPALQRLEKAILVQDPALERLERPRERAPAPLTLEDERPTRRLVTVVASEMPDGEQATRFAEVASAIFARHGGTVEQSGDRSIVAVFGVAAVREDDALRAVRAAIDLREEAVAASRTAVATGEMVVGRRATPLATEGPLEAAPRLRARAAPGEILVDDVTQQLVGDAVRVDASTVDGGWRVLDLIEEAPLITRPGDAPLVGRDFELEQLRGVLARTTRMRTPYLFTVLGDAGIGKSRLAREFVAALGDQAEALVGRCVSYGGSPTFRPLHDLIAQTANGVSRQAIRGLLDDDPNADAIARLVAAAVGGNDEAGRPQEETFWAVRRLLEVIAARRALVVVIDDLHWATSTFLDLLEHLADSTDAPLLLLCLARPELLERRPSWGGGMANATALTLEPLERDETEMLVKRLPRGAVMSEEARGRIAVTAAGNPLFAEQLTASLGDPVTRDVEIDVPPTIQALLAARLDRLGPGERAVIERAAVIGTEFSVQGVSQLLPQQARAGASRHLGALVRKRLALRKASTGRGADGFRFAHALIRDAAYRAMTIELRCELHERYADWLAGANGDRIAECGEVIGYHLEQAHLYGQQTQSVEGRCLRGLAARAAAHLDAAGRRALAREDMSGAAALLRRAQALLPANDPARTARSPAFARALMENGEFTEAVEALADALVAATASGDRHLRAHALLGQAELGIPTAAAVAQVQQLAEEATSELERLGDDQALARALWVLAKCHARRGRSASRREVLERALPYARRARDEELEADIVHHLWWSVVAGPEAIEVAQPYLDDLQRLAERTGSPLRESDMLAPLAYLRAVKGEFAESRTLADRAGVCLADLGLPGEILLGHLKGLIELLAGDAWAAERATRPSYERAEKLGYREGVVDTAMTLADALYAQGRYDEAERMAGVARDTAARGHIHPEILWRRVEAKVLAHRGHLEEAVALVREAQHFADQIDDLRWQAATLLDVGEVFRTAGRRTEADAAFTAALRLYERKGDAASALKTARLLAEA